MKLLICLLNDGWFFVLNYSPPLCKRTTSFVSRNPVTSLIRTLESQGIKISNLQKNKYSPSNFKSFLFLNFTFILTNFLWQVETAQKKSRGSEALLGRHGQTRNSIRSHFERAQRTHETQRKRWRAALPPETWKRPWPLQTVVHVTHRWSVVCSRYLLNLFVNTSSLRFQTNFSFKTQT